MLQIQEEGMNETPRWWPTVTIGRTQGHKAGVVDGNRNEHEWNTELHTGRGNVVLPTVLVRTGCSDRASWAR